MEWMFWRKKNAPCVEDKSKGTSKFNSSDISVEIDGRKITVAELEEAMICKESEEAEEAKKRELEAQEHEAVKMDESVTLANGKEYKVGELVENWKSRAAKKNAEPKKEDKTIGDLEKEEGDAEEAEAKKNAAEKEAAEAKEKEELEKKNAADEEAKKKAEAEAKDKEEAEKKENAKKTGRASFMELHNARLTPATEASRELAGAGSRAERAEQWKKKNGRK